MSLTANVCNAEDSSRTGLDHATIVRKQRTSTWDRTRAVLHVWAADLRRVGTRLRKDWLGQYGNVDWWDGTESHDVAIEVLAQPLLISSHGRVFLEDFV